MSRTFYTYAIGFTILLIAVGLTTGFTYLLTGSRVYELSSIFPWMICAGGTTLVWSVMTMMYYYHRKYWFVLWTSAIATVVSGVQWVVVYRLQRTHEITAFALITVQIALAAGVLHAIGLVFSASRRRVWLRTAGYVMLLQGALVIGVYVLAFISLRARLDGTLERADQWLVIAGSVVQVFFIFNFLNERNSAPRLATSHPLLSIAVGYALLIGGVAFAIVGPKVLFEAVEASRSVNQASGWMADVAKPFDQDIFVNEEGGTLRYRLLKPVDYDSTHTYPLVVCLHGSSGCGADNARQIATTLPALWLSTSESRERYPAFLFVPRCPEHACWGGIPGVASVDTLVFQTMAALQKKFSIDKNRIYLTGNSLGGYGAWHMACSRPEMFAAVMPICGAGDPARAEQLVNVPVWAFHGAKDMNVPVSGSRDMIEAIRTAGGNPRYAEFPEEAHAIGTSVRETDGVLEWL